MRAPRLLPLLALTAAATGCSLAPTYQRPDTGVPAGYRATPGGAADSSFADLPWWSVYQDTTLQRLIRTALAQNLDLQAAAERVRQAEARLGATRAALWPQVGAGANASRTELPSLVIQETSVGVNAAWELDLFGRLRAARARDKARLLASEEARRGAVLSVVSGVARGYFDLRAADEQLEVARRTATLRAEGVALAKRRFEGGMTGEIEYRQAQGQYEAARSLAIDLEEGIARLENALSVLTGQAPGAVARGRTLAEQPQPVRVPAGLPASLLERRPDVRGAEAELVALTQDVGVAKALRFPALSLTSTLGYASRELGDLLSNGGGSLSLGGGLLAPIFQGGRITAQVKGSEAALREGALRYRGTVLRALQETEDALVATRLSADREASLRAQVDHARAVLRLAEIRYDGGVAPYLEVLDAQRQLLTLEVAASDARRRALQALVDLYRALGGGWSAEAEATATGAAAGAAPGAAGGVPPA